MSKVSYDNDMRTDHATIGSGESLEDMEESIDENVQVHSMGGMQSRYMQQYMPPINIHVHNNMGNTRRKTRKKVKSEVDSDEDYLDEDDESFIGFKPSVYKSVASKAGHHSRRSSAEREPVLITVISQDSAACVIQKHYRGYRVRESLRYYHFIDVEEFISELYEQFLDDFLSGEFIPDLLIDVLTNKTNDYKTVNFEEQIAFDQCSNIVQTVVREELQKVVKDCIKEHVSEFLAKKNKGSSGDVVSKIVDEIVDAQVVTITRSLVMEVLREMANEYLMQQQFQVAMNIIIEKHIEEVVFEVWTENEEQLCVDRMVDDVVSSALVELSQEILKEHTRALALQRRLASYKQMEAYVTRIMENTMAEFLLNSTMTNGRSALFRRDIDKMLNRSFAESLMEKMMRSGDRWQAFYENRIGRMAYQKFASEAMTDSVYEDFLKELDDNEKHVFRMEAKPSTTGR